MDRLTAGDVRPRVAVGACFHETNTFSRATTDVEAFSRRGWRHGNALLDAYAGTHTVVGGMIDGSRDHDLDLIPIFGAYATPSGLVTEDAFQRIVVEPGSLSVVRHTRLRPFVLKMNDLGGDLTAVDHFAIEEGIDERYASGFGDLSVHEFATDPTEYLAYSSYYSGGMRVLRFGDSGLEQTGKFIDQGGNNFWGVEVFTTPQGDRLFAGSDRDFGLYIFRYTGPGAAQKPACSDVTVMVPYRQSGRVPFACSDANNNPLRQSRTSNPEGGTVADHPPTGGWTYTHTGNRLGPAGSFGFKANDGAADSNTATASLVAVARDGGRCFNPFVGSAARALLRRTVGKWPVLEARNKALHWPDAMRLQWSERRELKRLRDELAEPPTALVAKGRKTAKSPLSSARGRTVSALPRRSTRTPCVGE
jgi:hypothetical protein